jgi:hypothetical protein
VIAGGLLLVLGAWNVTAYFRATNDLRETFAPFDTTSSLLARGARAVLATHTPGGAVYQAYIAAEVRNQAVTRFLLGESAVGYFDGTRFAPPLAGPALVLLPGDLPAERYNSALRALGSDARLLRTGPPRPGSDRPIYLVYGTGPEAEWLASRLPIP